MAVPGDFIDAAGGAADSFAMLPRLGKLVVATMLCASLGLHWAFLQSVAWVGMVVTYAQSEPLPAALRMTFDGQHPCKVCTLVAEGKKSEEKQSPTAKLSLKKLEFPPLAVVRLLHPPPFEPARGWVWDAQDRLHDSPPTPPPRAG